MCDETLTITSMALISTRPEMFWSWSHVKYISFYLDGEEPLEASPTDRRHQLVDQGSLLVGSKSLEPDDGVDERQEDETSSNIQDDGNDLWGPVLKKTSEEIVWFWERAVFGDVGHDYWLRL